MQTMTKKRIHVRYMVRKDLSKVLGIEKKCFDGDLWGEKGFLKTLRQVSVVGLVATIDDEVIGFCIYKRDEESSKLQIIYLGVIPSWQKNKVGTQFVNKLKNKLLAGSMEMLEVMVPDSELNVHKFLDKLAFRAKVVRRHFGSEDGYLFTYLL